MPPFPFNHLDDVAFNLALYEPSHDSLYFNSDRLECLFFNPLSNNNFVMSNEIDPDNNFLNSTYKCNYYNESELNELVSQDISLSLLHLNACSLIRNFDKFTQLLDATQHEFSAIGISETCVNNVNQNYINFIGHRFISSNRVDKCGGGAGLCLPDTLAFNILPDFRISNSALFDSVFVESENLRGKNLIVGKIYCSPNQNFLEFMESFQPFFERVTRDNKLCYIMSDFNLDLLNSDLYSVTNDFVNMLFSHALFPLILRPPRITSHSVTLNYNIFSNDISACCNNGLIINDLSKHLPIFSRCYSDAHSSSIKSRESVAIRNFSRQNINAFNNLLCETEIH